MGLIHGKKSEAKNLSSTRFSASEICLEEYDTPNVGYESGIHMGSIYEKKIGGKKSRATVPLKGQSNEIFYLRFFHGWNPLKPLTRFLKTFRIWLRIR